MSTVVTTNVAIEGFGSIFSLRPQQRCNLALRRDISLANTCSTSVASRCCARERAFDCRYGERAVAPHLSRRAAVQLLTALTSCTVAEKAFAFATPPQGFKLYRDRLDGYSFFLPETWTPLSSSGNDVFFRNPYNVNENLFVSVSSPSSSKYASVADLRSPEAAAERTREQYIAELMSTRLGVKRTADVVSASERTGSDSKLYYDIELDAKSFASRNQLAVSQTQVSAAVELEWERRYITVLGVANRRLYEFRLQTAKDTYDRAKVLTRQRCVTRASYASVPARDQAKAAQETLLFIAQSFQCTELEA